MTKHNHSEVVKIKILLSTTSLQYCPFDLAVHLCTESHILTQTLNLVFINVTKFLFNFKQLFLTVSENLCLGHFLVKLRVIAAVINAIFVIPYEA